MRIVVLGAAGAIGKVVAEALARRGRCSSLVVADRDAKSLASLPFAGAETVVIDAADGPRLDELFADADVVANCTTYHLGVHVLTCAIRSGADYVDLGGLYNTPRQLELDDRAKAAGITAVLGCGATPGLTNLMTRHAAAQVAPSYEVEISFASHRDLAPSPGLLDTILDEFRPSVSRYYWNEGDLVEVEPFSGELRVRFPDPVGEQSVFVVPHSELHTLPRTLEGLTSVAVRGTWRADDMKRLRALAELGLTEERAVSVEGVEVSPLAFVRSVLLSSPPAGEGPCTFFLHVQVRGSDGSARVVASHPLDWGPRATALMTGLPTVVAVEKLAAGEVERKGVLPPDAAFPPEPFFAAVAQEGISIETRVGEVDELSVT